jgi:hypothetical protein
MDSLVEIALRVGPLLVFGAAFIAFVYWITQIQPRKAERKGAPEKDAGR